MDHVYGDRNLVCSCVGMEAYAEAPKPSSGAGVFDVLKATAQRLDAEEKRLAEAVARLEQEKKQLRQQELAAFERFLSQHDPDVRSPVTQDALSRNKSLLDRLGFSVKAYIDKHRLHGAR